MKIYFSNWTKIKETFLINFDLSALTMICIKIKISIKFFRDFETQNLDEKRPF